MIDLVRIILESGYIRSRYDNFEEQ